MIKTMKGFLLALTAVAALVTVANTVQTSSPNELCDKEALAKTGGTCPYSKGIDEYEASLASNKDEAKSDCCSKVSKAKAIVAQADEKDGCCKGEAKTVAKVDEKEDCCKSTEAKVVKKGEGECCNAPGKLAKFKVWADGKYYYYGCEGSAGKGRVTLAKKGMLLVGKVQPVVGKVQIS